MSDEIKPTTPEPLTPIGQLAEILTEAGHPVEVISMEEDRVYIPAGTRLVDLYPDGMSISSLEIALEKTKEGE